MAKEVVQVAEPRSGQNALPADVAEARPQELQKLDLEIVSRTEVGMTAFGCGWDEAMPVPNEDRFTEPRARGENGDVAALLLREARVAENVTLSPRHFDRAESQRDEVVQQR